MNLHQLLVALLEQKAEALHVTTGSPPQLQLDREWVPLKTPALTPDETKQLLYCVLTDGQKEGFERDGHLHFSFGVKGLSRFLANGYLQRGACAATFWPVPFTLPEPPAWVARTLSMLTPGPGVCFAAGPRRLPVSTLLARWVDHLNRTEHSSILTIEEPITTLHPHLNCLVDQVEVPADVPREQLREVASGSGANVLSVDVDDGLPLALRGVQEGRLVFCALRAPNLDVASALLRASVPAHLGPLVRGLVFVDGAGEAVVIDGLG